MWQISELSAVIEELTAGLGRCLRSMIAYFCLVLSVLIQSEEFTEQTCSSSVTSDFTVIVADFHTCPA